MKVDWMLRMSALEHIRCPYEAQCEKQRTTAGFSAEKSRKGGQIDIFQQSQLRQDDLSKKEIITGDKCRCDNRCSNAYAWMSWADSETISWDIKMSKTELQQGCLLQIQSSLQATLINWLLQSQFSRSTYKQY